MKWNGPPSLSGVVAVVGGGNTAIDAARTALRCGAKKVVLLYRRTRAEMPAEEEEIEDAVREGIELEFLVAPKKAVVEGKTLVGLECCRMKLGESDASGRPRPVEVKGSEFLFKADWVISAIGQDQNLLGLNNKSFGKIGLTKANSIEADPESFQTSVAGVFAGGDVVTGPATAVEAIAAGRKAAATIARVSRGKEGGDGRLGPGGRARDSSPDQRAGARELRARQCLRGGAEKALHGQRRLHDPRRRQGQPRGSSVRRLQLRRGQRVGRGPCPCRAGSHDQDHEALDRGRGFLHGQPDDDHGARRGRAGDGDHHPAPKDGTRFSFQKFRIRNSIDFPIVSVASALSFDGAKIKEARIVFGAVAPIPLRATNVEEALVGRKADEQTAELAGEVAAKQVFPLERNRYKVQILKGLIRKAILAGE